MTLSNSHNRYGLMSRALHWLMALMILSIIPIGFYAQDLPETPSAALNDKIWFFSLHKTLGVSIFALALIRIIWSFSQPRPAPLHPERRLENFMAELVHWSLYLSLVFMPLSGWVEHSALSGFAPIRWPFGQDLPFVPKSEIVAHSAALVHIVFSKILIASLILHLAGVVKHVIIDRDKTLARMAHGATAGDKHHHTRHIVPALAAIFIYAIIAGAAIFGTMPATVQADNSAPMAQTGAQSGNWQVTKGQLNFTITQMGAKVTGTFPKWTADITFDETIGTGNVKVVIDMTALDLGSVTGQAQGADFFDIAAHPQAVFTAPISRDGDNYLAKGTLTLRGKEMPVALPFSLTITNDQAQMEGRVTLDRRDFDIGKSHGDEATVGFGVEAGITLEATRQ